MGLTINPSKLEAMGVRVMSKVMSKAMKSKTPQLTVRNLVTLPQPLMHRVWCECIT
jgi:hypothetical protein